MTLVLCNLILDVSTEATWQVISDFGAANQYLAGVAACTVAGTGPGALRTLTYVDGSAIVERLETLDEDTHELSYTLLTDTPFCNCLTTIAVCDLGSNRAEVAWSATFEPDGLPANEAAALMECALEANCQALKQYLETGRN